MFDKFLEIFTSRKTETHNSRYLYKVAPKKKIHYLNCTNGNFHSGEPLNYICTDKKCVKKMLCCSVCIEQDHKNHQYYPLKLIIGRAEHIIQKKNLSSIQKADVQKCIQRVRENFFEVVIDKQQMGNVKKSIYRKVQQFFEGISKEWKGNVKKMCDSLCVSFVSPSKIIQRMYSKLQRKQFIEYAKQVVHIVKMQDREDIAYNMKVIKKRIKMFQKNSILQISNTYRNINNLFSQTYKTFITQIQSIENYNYFNQIHNNLSTLTPLKLRSNKTQSYKFAIAAQPITQNDSITFKLTKGCMWTALGICDKQIIKKNKFSFKHDQIGHGAYMISSNGGSWSHHESINNNIIKSIQEGDMVIVSYGECNQIIFTLKNNEKYRLKVQKNKMYYPCGVLYYVNDEIEICRQ